VADNDSGSGINANSADFYIKRASDNHYWNGTDWNATTVQWLSTTHSATSSDTGASWMDSVSLPTWSSGETYYSKVRISDKAGNTYEGSEITFYYDADNPTTVETIYDGTDTNDDAYIASTSQISANWTPSTDSISGIDKYQYRICADNSCAGDSDPIVDWTDVSSGTSITKSGLSLINGETYYFNVRAVDNAGNIGAGAYSDGVTIDAEGPLTISAVYDGLDNSDDDYTNSTTQLSVSWTTTTDEISGLDKYQYSIGTSAGSTNIVNWTDVSSGTSITKSGLSLINGETYYFNVRAVEG